MNDIQSTEYTKVHSLISSHPGNHLYNQDNKHIHHPKSYLILPCNSFFFLLSRPPTPSYLTIICLFLSHLMYLHFLEFYVHSIICYSFLLGFFRLTYLFGDWEPSLIPFFLSLLSPSFHYPFTPNSFVHRVQ